MTRLDINRHIIPYLIIDRYLICLDTKTNTSYNNKDRHLILSFVHFVIVYCIVLHMWYQYGNIPILKHTHWKKTSDIIFCTFCYSVLYCCYMWYQYGNIPILKNTHWKETYDIALCTFCNSELYCYMWYIKIRIWSPSRYLEYI